MTGSWRPGLLAAGLAATATLAGTPLRAQPGPSAAPIEERTAACTACHGEGGVSRTPDTPSLAGQHSFYAVTQLFLFREGRRTNAAMTAVAKGMSDADLRAFSDWIGKLPAAANEGAKAAGEGRSLPDAGRVARGAALAARHRCTSCHGTDLAGGQQVPRVGGQREEYLVRSLAEFRAGTRVGYTPAMNEALAGVAVEDLPDLAHYLAHPGAAAAAAK